MQCIKIRDLLISNYYLRKTMRKYVIGNFNRSNGVVFYCLRDVCKLNSYTIAWISELTNGKTMISQLEIVAGRRDADVLTHEAVTFRSPKTQPSLVVRARWTRRERSLNVHRYTIRSPQKAPPPDVRSTSTRAPRHCSVCFFSSDGFLLF